MEHFKIDFSPITMLFEEGNDEQEIHEWLLLIVCYSLI